MSFSELYWFLVFVFALHGMYLCRKTLKTFHNYILFYKAVQPRRWRSGLEHLSRKVKVGCPNPSHDRLKALKQVVTDPLPNALTNFATAAASSSVGMFLSSQIPCLHTLGAFYYKGVSGASIIFIVCTKIDLYWLLSYCRAVDLSLPFLTT